MPSIGDTPLGESASAFRRRVNRPERSSTRTRRNKDSQVERSRARKLAKRQRDKTRKPRVERAYKYRIYADAYQETALDGQSHTDRALWNLCHGWWLACLSIGGIRPSRQTLEDAVKQGRRDIDWLRQLPAQAAQQVVKNYVTAWKRRWDGISGAPDFHSRATATHSFHVPQARDLNFVRETSKFASVQLPLAGRTRLRYHRPIPNNAIVTGATVTHKAGFWELVVKLKLAKPQPRTDPATRPVIAYDRGITVPFMGSDGQAHTHDPWLTSGEQRRLRRLEQAGARKREIRWARSGGKGRGRIGKNELAIYDKIARIRALERRRREDWQHKETWAMATETRGAIFEDLHVPNMTGTARGTIDNPGTNVAQKAGLNRAILGEAWAALMQKAGYKLLDNGGWTDTVPAPGTSQERHACGSTRPGQRETQAFFRCRNFACGWSGNADYNAARNVLNRALVRGLIPDFFGGTPKAARSRHELETLSESGGAIRPLGLAGNRENRNFQRPAAA